MINYEPIERIHQSEHGSVVLKVKNTDTGEICALKLIGQLNNKLNRLIFKREVAALRKLNQFEDVVKIYDSSDKLRYKKQSGYGAILLELLDGQPFHTIDFCEFSDLKKIIVCRNSAMAVLHAHQCGVLHRDIKPSNIMLVDNNNKIKMIDFGSSKLKAIVDEETNYKMFTTGYVAPEVAQGQEATEKSDIYSLGAVFHYIFFSRPPSNDWFRSLLASTIISEMQSLLQQMLVHNPEDRIEDMQSVVDLLDSMIGKLNANAFSFRFYVDSTKLDTLKQQYTIARSMTYQKFLTVYLPKEFLLMHGMFNQKESTYEFVGDSLYMACLFDSSKRQFNAVKLYEIPIDKRSKLQRIFGLVEGKKNFIGNGVSVTGHNHSNQLKTQLHNYSDERNSLESKNRIFEELFGKWRDSINESFESIKEKSIQIEYSDYWFEKDKLNLYMKCLKGVDIDNLTQETHFVFEAPENQKVKTIPIGCFEDYYQENEHSILVLSLDKNITQGKLNSYLQNKTVILEDYKKHTVSLRRQLAAITALKNDEYNTAGLKDIILELIEPTSTHSIQSLKFKNVDLNDSQRQAVKKAIYSNNISLIQGPPGTGKTSVIAELIYQILSKASMSDSHPKILVASQSHTAVDNILEKLSSLRVKNLRIVRIGKKCDVSDTVASQYLVDAIKDNLFAKVQTSSSSFIKEKIDIFSLRESDDQKVRESKKASLTTWKSAQAIHEDWLKRCGDYASLRYQIVNTATIIAGTCIGFMSDENVRDMAFDYVIVDEAAKATTPELLVSIIKAEKIVLVGDQNQLAPFADATLSRLLVSLVKDPKYRIFDILYESLPDTHKQFLATQYRMCSAIGNLISNVFYDGKIITGVADIDRKHDVARFAEKSIVWIDTSKLPNHDSCREVGGSTYNKTEVQIIRKLLDEMNSRENAKNLDIGIITGYKAQKDSILKIYRNGNFKNIGNVDINTLDAFQGRENDIIIYSTVRTNGSIGFQQEKERVNVAFSRAKRLLIVCGDMRFFETWGGLTNKFVEIIQFIRDNPNTCQVMDAKEII